MSVLQGEPAGRRWPLYLVVALVALGALWLKVRLEAGQSLAEAQAIEAEGDALLAIAVYKDAVSWYSPGSGPVDDAVARLLAFSRDDVAPERALAAARALRGAIFAIRSTWSPYSEHLPELNDRIARLMTRGMAPEHEARHRALLERDHAPALGWSLLAVFAFVAWVGCLFGLATRGFDEDGAFSVTRSRYWLLGFALTAMLWMVGLALA
ncbi:MAG: hypothetical protein IV100_23620 [Myxococcales bacterium]|nr:hypothetical protein [Myxococcales bacterium]